MAPSNISVVLLAATRGDANHRRRPHRDRRMHDHKSALSLLGPAVPSRH